MNLPAVDERRVAPDVSIYELTLAEFPLFVISTAPEDVKKHLYYRYKDTIKGKDGQQVERQWTLYRDPEHGFPNESTFSTLYELFQIWKEQGFASQTINFGSFANLIQRKGYKGRPGKKDYDRIRRDLDCLRGVRIKAQNAFWDPKREAYVDKDFNLFNEVTTYKSTPNSNAHETVIEASQTLFRSIVENSIFVTDVPSDVFHGLTPTAQSLAIYLSKIFRFQNVHKRKVDQFAKQLVITAKAYKHIKQSLIRACEAVKAAPIDLLEDYDFETIQKRPKIENIVLFSGKPKKQIGTGVKPHSRYPKQEWEIDQLIEDIIEVCKDRRSHGFYRKVAYYMPKEDIYQALSEVKQIMSYSNDLNPGAVFTNRIKTFAEQRKISIVKQK